MNLRRLLDSLERYPGLRPEYRGDPDSIAISGLCYHSPSAKEGDLFACLRGLRVDGHAYAGDAVQRGAVALLVERFLEIDPKVVQIAVSDTRLALAVVSESFYGNPSSDLTLIGVTGTSGKTTTTSLIRHILTRAGIPTGSIGTLGTIIGGEETAGILTTPEAPDLARAFAAMRDAGDRAAVMEVSSHALVFQRVAACDFDVGVFTNLAAEHLDFHNTLDEYAAAKSLLFSSLEPSSQPDNRPRAAINSDDPVSEIMIRRSRVPVLRFGIESGELRALDLELSLEGSRFDLRYPDGAILEVRLALPARYNVQNAVAAAAVAHCLGLNRQGVAEALGSAQPVPGRFEVIEGEPGDPMVVVDFAHTPDELENLLGAARDLACGKLILVFGCGGDRDRTKRPVMGELSTRIADHTLISSDNPRSEDPDVIAAEVAAGASPGSSWEVVVDRGEAIDRAVAGAGPDDVVILAGKGHEPYQIFADKTIAFDEFGLARRALARRRKGVSS